MRLYFIALTCISPRKPGLPGTGDAKGPLALSGLPCGKRGLEAPAAPMMLGRFALTQAVEVDVYDAGPAGDDQRPGSEDEPS